jgi:SAM-dependent methyltransferase
MEHLEYERLREHEERYWWHVGRRDLLAAILRRHVAPSPDRVGFDIGCGTGANFSLLAPYGRFFGSEITGELWTKGRPRPARAVAIARGEALPVRAKSVGLCTFFDVLEHVDDDVAFLSEVRRVLVPGGLALLSVPAYPYKRRYVRRTLEDAVRRAGLRRVRLTFGMTTMFPLIAGFRMFAKALPRRGPAKTSYVATPGPVNALLAKILRAEAAALSRVDLPFGTSIFCLAQNPEAP